MALRRSSRTRRKDENSQPAISSGGSGASAVEETHVSKRKRTRHDSPEKSPIPKRTNIVAANIVPSKTVNGKMVDPYCWVCHQLADELTCGKCCRVFHQHCLKKELKLNSVELGCECNFTTVDGTESKPWTQAELKEALTYALLDSLDDKKNLQKKNKIKENKVFYQLFKIWPDYHENASLCKIVDVDILTDKINMPPFYRSTGQFFADVKWIHHNCYIFHGSDNSRTQQAHAFVKNVKQALLDVEACRECYHHRLTGSNNYFTGVCQTPHDIVWAKVRGSPFWPAKCLRIHKGQADVRFFGTHDKSIIALDQVFRISKDQPNKTGAKETVKYNEAIRELHLYETNHQAIHGLFKYYPLKTPLEKNAKVAKKGHKRGKGRGRPKENATTDAPGSATRELDQLTLNVSVLYDTLVETKVRASHDLSFASEAIVDDDDDPVIKYNLMCEVTQENNPEDFAEGPPASQQPSQRSASSINVNSNTMPVITSTVSASEFANNDQARQENTTKSASGNRLPSAEESNSGRRQMEQINDQILTGNGDDDDIQMIEENRNHTLVDTVTQSGPMMKTLCELLLSNRPAIREHLSWFQNAVVKLYLTMWLEAMSPRVDANDCKAFQMIYEKLLVMFGQLQAENKKLKEKVAKAFDEQQIHDMVGEVNKKYSKIFEEKQLTINHLNKVISQLEKEIQKIQSGTGESGEDYTIPREMLNVACQTDDSRGSRNHAAPVPTEESDMIQKIRSSKVVIKQVSQHFSRKVVTEPVMMPSELYNQAMYKPHLQVQQELDLEETTRRPSSSTIPQSNIFGQKLDLEPTHKYKSRNKK